MNSSTVEIYSDFPNHFTMHPIRKDITRITNEDAIKNALKNIILTSFYERPFRPMFGGNLRRYLFEPLTPITLEAIRKDLIIAVETHEPRANLVDIIVSGSLDNNSVNVTITFTAINKLEVIQLSTNITLDRVR